MLRQTLSSPSLSILIAFTLLLRLPHIILTQSSIFFSIAFPESTMSQLLVPD